MTPNKLTGKDFRELYSKINCDFTEETNKQNLFAFFAVIRNEKECCVHEWYNLSSTKPLTPRNIVCFSSFTNNIFVNDLKSAWWELIDILDDVKDDDYIEADELVLFALGFEIFIKKLEELNKCD